MKAKVSKGSGFRGVLDYALGKDRAEIVAGTMAGETSRELATEFGEVRQLRPEISRPVWHCSLALPSDEIITPEQWQRISTSFLSRMGIDPVSHQWVAVRHRDTEHDHIHIILNRVRQDGSIWNHRRDVYLAIEACQGIEKDFGLVLTPGREAKTFCEPSFTRGEIEAFKRTGKPDSKIIVARAIAEATAQGPIPVRVFVEALEAQGVRSVPNISSTGRVNGFSFEYSGVALKGSDVSASWKHLSEVVEYVSERDAQYLQTIRDAYRDARNTQKHFTGTERIAGTGGDGTDDPDRGAGEGRFGPRIASTGSGEDLFSVGEDAFGAYQGGADGNGGIAGSGDAVEVEAENPDMDTDFGSSGWDAVLDTVTGLAGTESHPLQTGSTDGRREPMTSKSVQYKRSLWDRQSEALGAPLYRVTVRGRGAQDGRTINLCKGKDGNEILWSADTVSSQIPTLEYWNAKGFDVYLTPIDDSQHHVLIDDLTAQGVEYIKANYHPAIICSSSAGNWQAVLRVPKESVSSAEQSAGNALMRKLNNLPDGCGGDSKISAVRHPFRMAGFRNKKPGRQDFQTKIELWQPGQCERATAELEELRARFATENIAERERFVDRAGDGEIPVAMLDEDEVLTDKEVTAFREYAREWNRARGLHAQHPEWGEADRNRWDYRATKHLLEKGYSEDTTRKAIRRCSPNVSYRHADVWDYAIRTVASVLMAIAREADYQLERM